MGAAAAVVRSDRPAQPYRGDRSPRPAVAHKDVLSQADILIAMKLTASQDRDAIGGWIESQADRQKAGVSSATCRACSAARGICGRPATAFSIASPFRRSALSTARARPSAASVWRRRARLSKWTSPLIVAALAAAEDPGQPKILPRA